MADSGARPYPTLVRAALAHPLAYVEHRLEHFNIASRFLVHDEVQGPAPDREIANQWHFTVTRNVGIWFINKAAEWSQHSPLGWPIWWIALAAGLLALSPYLPSRWLVAPVALSALLYGLGYLPFGVSSELRYHLWTVTGTGIAAAFAVADLAAGTEISRARLLASFAPALAVGLPLRSLALELAGLCSEDSGSPLSPRKIPLTGLLTAAMTAFDPERNPSHRRNSPQGQARQDMGAGMPSLPHADVHIKAREVRG